MDLVIITKRGNVGSRNVSVQNSENCGSNEKNAGSLQAVDILESWHGELA